MGQAVVHFEVIGKDGEKLRRYYRELFGWTIDADNPMSYGFVQTGSEVRRSCDSPMQVAQFRDPEGNCIGLSHDLRASNPDWMERVKSFGGEG